MSVRLGVAAAVVGDRIVPGDVALRDGVVAAVGLAGAGRGLAAPGLVDLQVNGFAGVDLLGADEDAVRAMGRQLLRAGVTAYQPTLITSPREDTLRALRAIGGAAATRDGARVLGVHLEGPFLSPRRPGTHPPEHLRAPDRALLAELLGAGRVTTVTLAPELDGSGGLIDDLVRRGVLVSLGHSDATAGEAAAAFDRGARTVTHLFNAMRAFRPRDPGVAGAALARESVVVQMIVDGVHLASDTVLLAWRAARGRSVLVSDSIAAAGVGDGTVRLGTVDVEVRDGVVRRADGTLAGSVGPLLGAVRRVHALGVPLAEALAAATSRPAELLGVPDAGRLAPGAPADLIVLDDRLELQRVIVAGVEVVGAGEALA